MSASRGSSRWATTPCVCCSTTVTTRVSTRGPSCTTSAAIFGATGRATWNAAPRPGKPPRTPYLAQCADSSRLQCRQLLRGAMDNSGRKVDFGFEKVAWDEKAQRVRSVFASVAGKYDVMNDLMSFGVHRLWKRFPLSLAGLKVGQRALDVAGGTGDLAAGMLRQVGKSGQVVLSDVNPAMLDVGRDRLLDQGFVGNVECVLADAERLPFEDNCFDCVTIGFGLRNVTDKAAALESMHRVLKPGGQLLLLEFSTPVAH